MVRIYFERLYIKMIEHIADCIQLQKDILDSPDSPLFIVVHPSHVCDRIDVHRRLC